jgi:hypothetical protein
VLRNPRLLRGGGCPALLLRLCRLRLCLLLLLLLRLLLLLLLWRWRWLFALLAHRVCHLLAGGQGAGHHRCPSRLANCLELQGGWGPPAGAAVLDDVAFGRQFDGLRHARACHIRGLRADKKLAPQAGVQVRREHLRAGVHPGGHALDLVRNRAAWQAFQPDRDVHR